MFWNIIKRNSYYLTKDFKFIIPKFDKNNSILFLLNFNLGKRHFLDLAKMPNRKIPCFGVLNSPLQFGHADLEHFVYIS